MRRTVRTERTALTARTAPRRGWYLLSETTAALAILGIGLVMTGALVAAAPGAARRVAAHRAALNRLEDTLERVRAGEIPLRSANLASAGGGRIQLRVDPVSRGLFSVTVTERFLSDGRPAERSLHTMVWRS